MNEKMDNSKQSEAFFQTFVAAPVHKSTLTYWQCVFKHIASMPGGFYYTSGKSRHRTSGFRKIHQRRIRVETRDPFVSRAVIVDDLPPNKANYVQRKFQTRNTNCKTPKPVQKTHPNTHTNIQNLFLTGR